MIAKKTSQRGRVERRKEETKHKIITVAVGLFKNHGFDATTMEQIADEVDIAKGTLYNYFPVKEAILSEYIQRSFQEKNSQRIIYLRKLPTTQIRMLYIMNELMEGIQAQHEILEKYLTYQVQNMLSLRRDDGIKSGFEQLGAEIVMIGQQCGELRSDIPLEILTALFGFTFITIAQQFYAEPDHFNIQEVIKQCVDVFLSGAGYSS